MHNVYFIATDMANKPLQTTLKKAQGPYGWMTSAAQGRSPVWFSVPGGSGEGTTAAIGRMLASPATLVAMDTDYLWVRIGRSFGVAIIQPPLRLYPLVWNGKHFSALAFFKSVFCDALKKLLSLSTKVIKFLFLKLLFFT